MPTNTFRETVDDVAALRSRVAALETLLAAARSDHEAAESRLRTLIDFAPEAIVMLEVTSGRFIDVNPAAERLFGLSRESLLEKGPVDLSPPAQPTGPSPLRAMEKIALAMQGEAVKFDWWHCNLRGERFLTEVNLVRMPWGGREVVRGSIVDITSRKLLELSERGRSRVLEGIARGESLDTILDALARTIESLLPEMKCSVLLVEDKSDRLRVRAAPNLPEFYSIGVDGLLIGPAVGSCGAAAFTGRRIIAADLKTHPNWAGFRDLARRAGLGACWSEPIISFSGEVLGTFAMYYADPTEPAAVELGAIEIAANLATLVIEHDRSRRALFDLNATLEQRVSEKTRRLIESNQKLKSADELLAANQILRQREAALAHSERLATMGQMAAEFAHELNQPLYAICNFAAAIQGKIAQLAANGADMSDTVRWIEQISQQARRASEMMRRVLQFSRKGELDREALDLNVLIRDLSLMLNVGMRSKSIQVEYQLADGLPLFEGDRVLIEQVLVNLVRNAADSMEAAGRERRQLVIRTSVTAEGAVECAVSDSGLGLPQEDLDRLFVPYFTTKPDGSGMGLAICRSTIDAHQGRIWATNNPDGGATFHFVLPAVLSAPPLENKNTRGSHEH